MPITYYPRPEGSAPNLSSFSDGWRHLKHILLRAPTLLFLIPGFVLFALGMLVVFISKRKYIHTTQSQVKFKLKDIPN